MRRSPLALALCILSVSAACSLAADSKPENKLITATLDVTPKPIAGDKSVKYDYDIVYVRAQRAGDKHKRFYTDIATPISLEPGADLMLLRPDGSEELLVAGGEGAITDPVVAFDGESVYYSHIYSLKGAGPWTPAAGGADIFKIHVKSRKITKLTDQTFTPNTGAADWADDLRKGKEGQTSLSYGVFNMGPCPLPGGRIAFTSNRNAFRPPRGYPTVALQLFVMDEDGGNVDHIGHLNVAGALHPVVLADGRIIFSSLESQGARSDIAWGIWAIRPDGTQWNPVVSAFDPGAPSNAFHFQAQLSDRSIIVEGYYNQNNSGFGTYIKLPAEQPYPAFGPAYRNDPRNAGIRFGRDENGHANWYRMPFTPIGTVSLTPFAIIQDSPAGLSDIKDKKSERVGKFTHPSGAPDNHLLTVFSPGPSNHQYTYLPQIDGGIYLIKDGKVIDEPGQMLIIKNDPNYNECWPRALVPYKRIYGIDEPKNLTPLANDGKASPHLPEGTPYGLVGTSSFYKRETYPNGSIPKGTVTAGFSGGNDPWKNLDPFTSHGNGITLNWHNQGAEAGLYTNDDIHAVRVVVMEPTTDRNRGPKSGRLFHSHAQERMRVLGEIPLRKFAGGEEPKDPDGNPDTSFLAKIPADTPFSFQTIDKHGMVLNAAQTWHQLRPGEIRHDCGGCHAHSQEPTPFEKTAAGKPDYKLYDLTKRTPLVTSKAKDESKKKWDADDASGVRYSDKVASVEYHRDIQPILARSCVACHTKESDNPAGNLALDADGEQVAVEHRGKFPGTYYRLAMDERAKFGHKPVGWDSWGVYQASRYVRKFQSRRSLLTWKLYGKRLDGFSNDDHPSETEPGSGKLARAGKEIGLNEKHKADLDFTGGVMPPPAAIEGKYVGADGKLVKVAPLSDEDRRTLVRWIDLGCPIDLDYDAAQPDRRGFGWMCDDTRPTLNVTLPAAGDNGKLERIVLGAADYYSGLADGSLKITADFELDGVPAGTDLTDRFKPSADGVWQLKLGKPIDELKRGTLTVTVKDRQGNLTRVNRTFRVVKDKGVASR